MGWADGCVKYPILSTAITHLILSHVHSINHSVSVTFGNVCGWELAPADLHFFQGAIEKFGASKWVVHVAEVHAEVVPREGLGARPGRDCARVVATGTDGRPHDIIDVLLIGGQARCPHHVLVLHLHGVVAMWIGLISIVRLDIIRKCLDRGGAVVAVDVDRVDLARSVEGVERWEIRRGRVGEAEYGRDGYKLFHFFI